MKTEDISFIKKIGIQTKDSIAFLEYKKDVLNHIDTIHAGAQFTLAELGSALYLEKEFPTYKDKVFPILRSSSIKYIQAAKNNIYAKVSLKEEEKQKFIKQFEKKARGTIELEVSIFDSFENITSKGSFSWFIQKL